MAGKRKSKEHDPRQPHLEGFEPPLSRQTERFLEHETTKQSRAKRKKRAVGVTKKAFSAWDRVWHFAARIKGINPVSRRSPEAVRLDKVLHSRRVERNRRLGWRILQDQTRGTRDDDILPERMPRSEVSWKGLAKMAAKVRETLGKKK